LEFLRSRSIPSPSPLPVAGLVLAALVLVAPPAFAQRVPSGMYRVEQPEAGYRFFCPRSFKQIPVQPGDRVVVGQYVQPKRRSGDARPRRPRSSSAVEMWIFSIAKPVDRPVVGVKIRPPVEAGTPGPEGAEPAETGPKPRSYDEVVAERLSASSFDELVKKRLRGWHVVATEEESDRERSWREIDLAYVPKLPPGTDPQKVDFDEVATRRARAWIYDIGEAWLGLVGFAPVEVFGRRMRDFARSARSLEPMVMEGLDRSELESFYAEHPEYKDPAFRIERRQRLARGWEAIDTENYLILHHTRDDRLLRMLERNLEAMRRFYEEFFPPAEPVKAVSVVRVCQDRQEYIDYGGAPRSAGYWNFVAEELVLYDNVAGRDGSRFGNRDTVIVLYHEAFHQYIHYSTVELPPHSWFNEGYADYFSGAVVYANTGNIKEVKANPWRVGIIRKAVEEGRHVPLSELIEMTKAQYYARASLCYAQGWSLVYFLETSRGARRHSEWDRILPTYFATLKTEWAKERLALSPQSTLEVKNKAGQRARDRALEAAFEGVDLGELEEEWKEFVSRLRGT